MSFTVFGFLSRLLSPSENSLDLKFRRSHFFLLVDPTILDFHFGIALSEMGGWPWSGETARRVLSDSMRWIKIRARDYLF